MVTPQEPSDATAFAYCCSDELPRAPFLNMTPRECVDWDKRSMLLSAEQEEARRREYEERARDFPHAFAAGD